MSEQTVADMIVSILEMSGVKRVYGLIGDSLNPIGDSIRRKNSVEWIAVRHEEAAAFAAGGEAFLSGELCVCAGTAGPGSVHLVNGLYEANRNNCPVLAIVTHIRSSEIGLDFFQETKPMELYKDCSIFCETVTYPSQMPRLLQEAMQTALMKKGVAVIIISKDISESLIEDSPYTRPVLPMKTTLVPAQEEIKKLADIINTHENVTLYCGIGCIEARDEVLSLAQTIKAPLCATIRSKDFMEPENPNYVGMNGMLSNRENRAALKGCDLLVLLGTDFPYAMVLPTAPTVVQIDINPKSIGRRSRLDLGINGDVKTVLDVLIPLLQQKEDDTHLKQSLAYKEEIDRQKETALVEMADAETLRPEYLTSLLSELADEEAIFAVDVGLNDVWASRYIKPKGKQRIIGSFHHATMAAAIPEGMGAFLATGKQIIVMAGDGGFSMLLGELLTIAQHNIPLKIIVYNNRELGYINFEAHLDKIPPFQTGMKNPDFSKVAEAIGIKGYHVDSPKGLKEILKRALEEEGPVVIDATTDPDALP